MKSCISTIFRWAKKHKIQLPKNVRLSVACYGKTYLCALSTVKIAYIFLNGIVRSPFGIVVVVFAVLVVFASIEHSPNARVNTNQHYYSSLYSVPRMEIASKWYRTISKHSWLAAIDLFISVFGAYARHTPFAMAIDCNLDCRSTTKYTRNNFVSIVVVVVYMLLVRFGFSSFGLFKLAAHIRTDGHRRMLEFPYASIWKKNSTHWATWPSRLNTVVDTFFIRHFCSACVCACVFHVRCCALFFRFDCSAWIVRLFCVLPISFIRRRRQI